MRNIFLTLLGMAFLSFLPAQAHAQIEKYTLDKPHTQILFFIDHMGFAKSMGKFTDYSGTIIFDRGEPQKSSVEVNIPTASIDLDDEKWNAHMKNADFFHVEKFPTMTFKSTNIEVTGENTANITGDLTLLGVTKPVTLAVVHNKSDKRMFGDTYAAGFSATGTLKRSDFGMSYGLPAVGDEVELRIEVEANREELGGEGTENQ